MVNSKSILLIEDDHDIRVCLRQTLESTGFNISSAANGRDALNLLQRNPLPRLIIVDLCMPIMSGEEFLQKRLHDPELKEIPVLVITSHKERIKLIKDHPFVMKPLDMDDFTAKVLECLKEHVVEN